MNWKIYYSDGFTISSENATPFSIPSIYREGVQVIIQGDNEHKWLTLSGEDYYVWDDRGRGAKWWRCNRQGLDHYLRQPGSKCVLFGTWIETEDYREVFNRARKEWGNKEIFSPEERRP